VISASAAMSAKREKIEYKNYAPGGAFAGGGARGPSKSIE